MAVFFFCLLCTELYFGIFKDENFGGMECGGDVSPKSDHDHIPDRRTPLLTLLVHVARHGLQTGSYSRTRLLLSG